MVSKHPIQPLVRDEHGILRFKENSIVRFLLDNGPYNMNSLASRNDFSQEDREQFAQLIGYSLCGFCDLSYVRDETKEAAEAMKPSESVCDECQEPAFKVVKDASSITHRFCESHWNEHVESFGNGGKSYGFATNRKENL